MGAKKRRLDKAIGRIKDVLETENVMQMEHVGIFVEIIAGYENQRIPIQVFLILGSLINKSGMDAKALLDAALKEDSKGNEDGSKDL